MLDADIGMEEAGLAEAIVEAVQSVHPHLHGLLFSNVLLTGAPLVTIFPALMDG